MRIAYFRQISASPLVELHRWTESDMYFFDRWAHHLAAGDWLQRTSLHPLLDWHRSLAQRWLALHPEAAAGLEDPVGTVYDRWLGGQTYHQEPLYAYLLALTYRVVGDDPRWVFGAQMMLGVGTVVLTWWVTRRHFGTVAAALAALFVTLCGGLVYFEATLLRETLIAFCAIALVDLTDRAYARPTLVRWLAV